MMKELIDYYNVGNIDDIYVSNSLMAKLDPDMGGSPQAAYKFLTEQYIKPTVPMINGTLIHKWLENPDDFVIADFNLPSEMAQDWVKDTFRYCQENPKINEKQNLISIAIGIKESLDYYKNIKSEEKITEKWENECQEYYNFLKSGISKIALTKDQKELITNITNHLSSKKTIKNIIFNTTKSAFEKVEFFTEVDIFVTIKFRGNEIKIKVKVDKIILDYKEKKIKIIDYKTTSSNPYDATSLIKKKKTHRQLYFYGIAVRNCNIPQIKEVAKNSDWSTEYYAVFMQTKEPYSCIACKLNSTWYSDARNEIAKGIERVVYHSTNNDWFSTKEESDNKGILHPNFE